MDRSIGNTFNVSKEQNTQEIERRKFRSYPQYKDSGIEWFGTIPVHWDVKPFKALLSRNDSGVWGEDFADDGVLVLRSTEQTVDGKWNIESPARRRLTTREASDARLEVGDLVVTKSSGSELHIGKTSIVDQFVAALNCCFSNFIQRLRVAWPNLSRLYWYLLNCPVAREQLIFLSSTTTGLGNLNGSILGSIRVPVAPEEEQQAIATFLDRETAKIDSLIEKKERLIELLREKRTALITQAVTKGLNPTVPMKDSGVEWLGKIPAHWEVKRLKYVSRIIMGQSPPSDIVNILGDGLPFLQGNADFGAEHPTARTFCPFPNKVAAPKDILVSVRAPVGAINIADREYGIGRGLCAIRPYFLQLEPRYCSNFLQIAHPQLNSIATGSTYDAVSSDDVSCLAFPLPPIEEQHSISYFLDRETAKIDKFISRIREAITQLREYRAALISAAVTGKINVREA